MESDNRKQRYRCGVCPYKGMDVEKVIVKFDTS